MRRRFCGDVVGDVGVEGGLSGVGGEDDKAELLVTCLTNILVSLNLSNKPVYVKGSGPLEALASESLPPLQPTAAGAVLAPVGRACSFWD